MNDAMTDPLSAGEEVFCPHCKAASRLDGGLHCATCKTDFDWSANYPEFCRAMRHAATVAPLDESPPAIKEFYSKSIELGSEYCFTFGHQQFPHARLVELKTPEIGPLHAVLAWDKPRRRAWIVDNGSAAGTYVNRRRIRAAALQSGDLVQIGPYAWQFVLSRYRIEEASALLVPVDGIPDCDLCNLQLREVEVPEQLEPVTGYIPAGQFVAVIGPSGAGKSTLVKALLSPDRPGRVFFNGRDAALESEDFRGLLGYVSQQDTLHGDLTADDALEFSGRLRNNSDYKDDAARLIREVDLKPSLCDAPYRQLSGGEKKRVRTAAELIGRPRLLILDEPGSGLDRARERTLMRSLRSRAWRGCTVIVVTHGLHELQEVDRVILIKDKKCRFWGKPEELCRAAGISSLEELSFDDAQLAARLAAIQGPQSPNSDVAEKDSPTTGETKAPIPKNRSRFVKTILPAALGCARQTGLLVWREWILAAGRWPKRLAVSVVLLPLLFAAALATARLEDESLLFLAVLSSIFMGVSLSLLSIAEEWEIVDHERLLFLRPAAYVVAKWLTLIVMSVFQTLIFLVFLDLFTSGLENARLECSPSRMWPLFLIGAAAVGLGMTISAAAKGHSAIANFVFPFVMICQVIFSVRVLVTHQESPTVDAEYALLTMHECQLPRADGTCPLRAREYRQDPQTGDWVWHCGSNDHSTRATSNKLNSDEQLPSRIAVTASYGTLSRYGDLLLRLTASECRSPWRHPWGNQSATILVVAACGFPVAAWLIVRLHLSRKIPRWSTSVRRVWSRWITGAHQILWKSKLRGSLPREGR